MPNEDDLSRLDPGDQPKLMEALVLLEPQHPTSIRARLATVSTERGLVRALVTDTLPSMSVSVAMKRSIFIGALLFTSLASSSAHAAHYLLARGVNSTNGAKSVVAPAKDIEVIGEFATGTPSDNVWVNGRASANSDTGLLIFNVGGGAKPAAGTTASTPNNWAPAARIWETLSVGKAKPSTISARLAVTGSAGMVNAASVTTTFYAQLKLGPCRALWSRKVIGTSQPVDQPSTDCAATGFTATSDAGVLTVSGPMTSDTIDVDAELNTQIMYSGNYDGTGTVSAEGRLNVTAEGGDVVGQSTTFGTKANPSPNDAGVPGDDAGAGASSSSSSGSSPSGADAGPAPPESANDSSCAARPGRRGDHDGAVLGGAILLGLTLIRRRR